MAVRNGAFTAGVLMAIGGLMQSSPARIPESVDAIERLAAP